MELGLVIMKAAAIYSPVFYHKLLSIMKKSSYIKSAEIKKKFGTIVLEF